MTLPLDQTLIRCQLASELLRTCPLNNIQSMTGWTLSVIVPCDL